MSGHHDDSEGYDKRPNLARAAEQNRAALDRLANDDRRPATEAERADDDGGDVLDLDAIRARADAASPGPWTIKNGSIVHAGPSESSTNERWGTFVVAGVGAYDIDRPGPANTAFIAHARTDVPALLAEVQRQRAQLAEANKRRVEMTVQRNEAVRSLAEELAEFEAERITLICERDEARAKAVDGGEWVTDYGHDPGRPTVHGIEWHPGLHCIRDTYQRRVWYGPVEPVTDDESGTTDPNDVRKFCVLCRSGEHTHDGSGT